MLAAVFHTYRTSPNTVCISLHRYGLAVERRDAFLLVVQLDMLFDANGSGILATSRAFARAVGTV